MTQKNEIENIRSRVHKIQASLIKGTVQELQANMYLRECSAGITLSSHVIEEESMKRFMFETLLEPIIARTLKACKERAQRVREHTMTYAMTSYEWDEIESIARIGAALRSAADKLEAVSNEEIRSTAIDIRRFYREYPYCYTCKSRRSIEHECSG